MTPNISVVIPVKDEEKNIPILTVQLRKIFSKLKKSYEIIFIDDGSRDNSCDVIEKLHKKDSRVRIISFRKNFGKALAYKAGFSLAKGDIIITIDGDLQDDPAEIPSFIKKIEEGYDVVVGWKWERNDNFEKRAFSKIFNVLVFLLSRLRLHDIDCGYRAMRSRVCRDLPLHGGLYRFIPVLAYEQGYSVSEIKVKHFSRMHGKSKYRFGRIFSGFFDLITAKFFISYIKNPMHLFGPIGLIFLVTGFLTGILLLYDKIRGFEIGERPLLILTILLLIMGIQFISIGLLGESIAYHQGEEDYKIRKIL